MSSYRSDNVGFFYVALVIAIAASLFIPATGPGPVRAENNPEVIRIATPAWAKLTAKDGSGLYFDLLRKVYGPAGVKLEYRIAPLETGQGDDPPGRSRRHVGRLPDSARGWLDLPE